MEMEKEKYFQHSYYIPLKRVALVDIILNICAVTLSLTFSIYGYLVSPVQCYVGQVITIEGRGGDCNGTKGV